VDGIAGRQPAVAIPGFQSNGFRADGILTDGKSLLALEVECKQSHPDTNVGKFWLLNHTHPYRRMTLIHVFTPAYNSYGSRHALCQFYADKMNAEFGFEYFPVDRRQVADTDFEKVFGEICKVLTAKYDSFFR
jgi:hypothetical protein